MGVDGAGGVAGDHGADDVADGDGFGAEGDHFALGGEGVGGFSGLGDEDASGYGLCAFVGYQEGPYIQINQGGLDYKVFFEFGDATGGLTPSAYQSFSAALADAGYEGDSKVLTDPSLPLQARFQYNDIITHSSTIAAAEIAESVGLAMFGDQLTGYGRGLDVGPPIYSSLVDWHSYLCDVEGSLAALPGAAQAFVTFQN